MPAPAADELPPLSNQDVEILYTIVTTAARLNDPPYRALFHAYDQVLAERGIDPNQDRIYFRFLLHMRNAGGFSANDEGTATLYGRFETLLADMGIQVEVDEGGEGVEEVTRRLEDLDFSGMDEGMGEDVDLPPTAPPKPSRRASFDDTTLHQRSRRPAPWEDDGRIAPPGRYPGIGVAPRRASSRASDSGARRPRSRDARPAMHSGFPHRGRLNMRAAAENPQQFSRRGRPRSQSSQGSIRITRVEEIQRPAREPAFYDVDDFDDLSSLPSRRSSIGGPGPENMHYIPPEMLYRPSPTKMLADADTFLYSRTLFNARKAIHTWCEKALSQREHHAQMEQTADAFNKRILMTAGMEMLSLTLRAKRNAREIERFHAQREDRAQKARNLFLLTKAFTHWHTSTADEINRTNVARRHVLRYKFFNAWHEISAVDELKVRRAQLSKFFGLWRRRHAAVREEEELALAFRSENLVQQTYQACYWEFSGRRASKWHDDKLKRKAFGQMIDQLLQVTEKQALVQEKREQDMKKKTLQLLSNKMLTVQSQEPAAEEFRKRKLLSQAFGSFSKEAKLRPLERKVSRTADMNLLKQAISTWHVRTEQIRRAAEIDRLKVLRNAFTAWNDQLRCRALAARIDDRVLVQSLYKWSLAARAALLARVQNAKVKKNFFRGWVDKVGDEQNRLAHAERTFAFSQETRLKRIAFHRLRAVFEARKQREAQALEIYEPRLVNKTWHQMVARHEHVQQLDRWGSDAQFYTVATHALTRWRESTHHAQRMRRREAYATIRRHTKMSTARRVFEQWRAKAASLEIAERQAQELQENAVLKSATRLLSHWNDFTISLVEKKALAEQFRRERLVMRMVGNWLGKIRKIARDDQRAATLLRAHVDAEASSCLKKLNWRLFQIQRQDESGLALAERNFDKHAKNMLRHWAEQARFRRRLELEPVPVEDEDGEHAEQRTEEGSHVPGRKAREDNDAAIARNEDWTAFDPSALDLGDVKLNLTFDPNTLNRPVFQPRPPLTHTYSAPDTVPPSSVAAPNPFALTIRDPAASNILTSTPLPGYLRTPSKRSTVRAKARERLAALTSPAGDAGGNNENRPLPPHPLSQSVSAPGAAPSYSASTFALNTNTGSTTPMAAPSGFGSSMYSAVVPNSAAAQPPLSHPQAPGTAPPAIAGGGAFGSSTIVPATPAGPGPAKSAITPFARKLTAGGYGAVGGSGGRASSGGGGGPGSSFAGRTWGRGGFGRGPAFGGFEDIEEAAGEGSAEKGGSRGVGGR